MTDAARSVDAGSGSSEPPTGVDPSDGGVHTVGRKARTAEEPSGDRVLHPLELRHELTRRV